MQGKEEEFELSEAQKHRGVAKPGIGSTGASPESAGP
jgi:hypothetical protein